MKYQKTCAYCGEPFETNSPQKIYCNRPHYRPCPICGTPVKMIDNDFSRPPKCCSKECSWKLRQQRFEVRKCIFCGREFKPNSGCQIACSATHYDRCEVCGKEFVRTVANYNDGVTTCSPECTREKCRLNSLAKYGTEHPMQNQQVQEKFHDAMYQKYGVRHALQIPTKIKQQQMKVVETNMQRWGVPYACFTPNCKAAHPELISVTNQKFAERLNAAGLETTMEKVVGNRSFDIAIVGTNILIELDPTYTHNAYGNHYGDGLNKYYHRDKSQIAAENGYRCIHVFDWDNWTSIINIVKPIERKIHARECTIYKINKNVGDEFLSKYHIQGTCRGQQLYLGLVHQGQLVQLMTFGQPRFDKHYYVELLRLCTLPGTIVNGGASRLFSFATEKFGLYNIISYCDLAKFSGTVYEKIGMRFKRRTPPQEIWSKSTQRITANLLRARGFDQLFGTNHGKGTSNEELMIADGWLPVYDCGQRVYEFK